MSSVTQEIETQGPRARQGAENRPVQRPPVRKAAPEPQSKQGRRSVGLTLFLLAAIPLGVLIGAYYYAQSQIYQSTDDAFIDGQIINVSPKVSGRVERVLVNDNQVVKKGDRVVVLDDRDFVAARKQKSAALESARAQEGAVKASIDQEIAHVSSLRATVESDQATADASRAQAEKAARDFERIQGLFRNKVVSPQDVDAARAANDSAQAQLQANLKKVASDQAQVAEARATVDTYLALLKSVQAKTEQSDADLQTAQLNESYTELRAPEDGRVTRKAVEPGNYVQTGQTLFALVPARVWVTANYKENQIGLMRPGQPVQIGVDALPGRTFHGRVESIQAGSGARFSLLPPENATGNYVKVVQRVPVKIVFDESPQVGLPLGPGESVVPTVKVQDFHYTPVSVGVLVLATAGMMLIVLWLRSRPKRVKSQ
ncbi:MAG: HlyD family secretion protein [Verrucomicrobia bacterium]|nr:HlyD family secretion protein [Verrucomicrobiota bacterium]